MNKKSILILYTGDDWNLEEPEHSERFKVAYLFWGNYCHDNNILLTRAEINWYKSNYFKKYWIFNKEYQRWIKVEKDIVPSVIFDKARIFDKESGLLETDSYSKKTLISKENKFINPPEFSLLLDNKLNQYLIFQEFMPKTKFISSKTLINNENNHKIVMKLPYGSGGKHVEITSENIIRVQQNLISQEFIQGRNNQVLKDYRIVFIGEEIIYAASRIAKGNSDYTNTHKGAEAEIIDMRTIPEILKKSIKIAAKLEFFPKKIFSLDFLISYPDNIPILIEFNSTPGLGVFYKYPNVMEKFFNKLTNYLIS